MYEYAEFENMFDNGKHSMRSFGILQKDLI